MTKIKNTKKGMAKKTLSMSLVVAMLATSNVPVWAAEFSDGTDTTNITSEANAFTDAEADTPVVNDASSDAVSAQATDNEVTLTTDSTVKSLSTLKKDGLTVTTNYKDGTTKDFGCVSFVLKKGDINIGDANPSVSASNEELGYYVIGTDKSNRITTTTEKKSYTLKLDNWDKYVGKTITAILYQDTTSTSEYHDGKVYKTVDIKVTADSAQDYCDVQDGGEVEWGDTLPSVTPSMKAGASLTAGAWYKNGQAVAADYKTTSADVGATFEYKGTLAGTNTSFDGSLVTAKTLTIKGKQATDTAIVSRVSWTGFSEEIKNNGTLTCDYDGKAHQITINNFTTEKGEKISGEKFKYTYMRDGQETIDFTSAGTITVTATVEQAGALAKGQIITATLNIKGIDISKDTAATLKVNPLVYNRAGKYLNFKDNKNQDLTGDALANAVNEAGLVVEKNGKTLTYGTDKDYVVSATVVTENKAGKEVEVKIEGRNNYTGTVYKKLEITAADISKATVSDIADQPYTGSQIKPVGGTDFDVTVNDETLTYNADSSKSDYTLEYSNNVNVGKEATVTITGRGNYTGSVTKKFEITSISLANLKSAIESDAEWKGTKGTTAGAGYDYTGKTITPVKSSYGWKGANAVWMEGRDFSVNYVPQNTNAGDVKAVITGINNYAGQTTEVNFKINPVNISKVKADLSSITYSPDLAKKTDEIKSGLKVTYKDAQLTEKQDFTIDNVTVSNKKVYLTLTGIKNFTGTTTISADVTAKDINTVTLPKIDAQKYTGYEIKVDIDGDKGLKLTSKDITGTKDVTLAENLALKDGDTKLDAADYYIINVESNRKVGTATINLGGKGNYTGKVAISFPIVDHELNGTIVDSTNSNSTLLKDVKYSYAVASTLKGITYANLKVMDEKGNDITDKCDITYSDNKAVGTATIKATGKDGFKFNAVNTFRITPAELQGDLKLKKASATFDYTGEEIKPEYTFTATDGKYTLVEGTDYKVEYLNNVNVYSGSENSKKPTVKVTGLGNYAAKDANGKDIEVTKNFTISKVTLATTDIAVKDVVYAGGLSVKPDIVITNPKSGKALVEGTDYKVKLTEGGSKVGPAEAEIELTDTAAKNYNLISTNGTKYTVKFNVTALDLSKATISPIADQAVTGEQIKPAVTVMNGSVKLTEGKDYEVSYGENKEIGEGTVTIKALSSNKNYTGSQTVKFNIVKDTPVVGKTMISDVKVVGNKATVILSGDADGASGYDYVISTDKDCTTSKDYDAISKNQVKTSTAFKYVQKGTYYAYCHAWTRDKNGKKVFGEWSEGYEFEVKATTPAAPVITEVKVKGSTITVTYNKVSNVAGYDVVLGTSSKNDNGELRPYRYGDHKILNINKNKVTVQFKKVPKKNWVVGMRSFTKDPDTNKKVFSRWSNLMPAKVK